MKIIPNSSLEYYKKNIIVTTSFEDDLLPIKSDRKYIPTDRVVNVYKIFIHPKGSNIIYPLSRRYLYSLNQTYYTRSPYRQTFISSFGDIVSAYRFICKRSFYIFSYLRSYEELWLLKGHVPIGSLFITSRSTGSKYVESSSIKLDIEEHYNKGEILKV